MRLLLDDLRYAWRQLRRTPGFTFIAVLTLSLGIGATTAFFGVVNALLFRPDTVDYTDVHHVFSRYPDTRSASMGMQRGDFRALEAARPSAVLATTALDLSTCTVQIPGQAERLGCEYVAVGYADTFRIAVASGRWFARDDERPMGGETAVISDRLWRSLFRGDPQIIGTTPIKLGQSWRRVIGIMPPGFRGLSGEADAWVLQDTATGAVRPPDWWKQPRWPGVSAFVRVRPGATAAEIGAQIGATVATAAPGLESTRTTFSIRSAKPRATSTLGLWILAFAALVFFAACANLANMLYARGHQRATEIAVRLSLGATSGRIVRLFVAEAAIVCGLASAAGLGIAVGVSRWFAEVFPSLKVSPYSRTTIDAAFELDARVFLFALGLGAAAAIVVGLTSAWRSTRVASLRAVTASGSAGSAPLPARGLQTSLVSIQITAAVLLVLAASLFIENTRKAYDQRVDVDTSRLTAGRIELTPYEYRAGQPVRTRTEPDGRQFYGRLLAAARAMPGIEAAALVDGLPGATPGPRVLLNCFRAEDPDGVQRERVRSSDAARVIGSSEVLKAFGVVLRRGRDLAASDVYGGPAVAVVTEGVAASLWPGEDALGKKMHDCRLRSWLTVVGVSADVVRNRQTPVPYVFVPFEQWYQADMLLTVRSNTPGAHVDAIRSLVRGIDSDVALFEVAPVDDLLLAGVALGRASRTLALSLGGMALGISVLGVYGVIAYFVSRRTREFGLRLALGATRGQVLKLVIDRSVRIVLIGLVPGVLLPSLGARYLGNTSRWFLPNDIPTWFVVPALILVAGVIAAYVPAKRASRVDPNVALRCD